MYTVSRVQGTGIEYIFIYIYMYMVQDQGTVYRYRVLGTAYRVEGTGLVC